MTQDFIKWTNSQLRPMRRQIAQLLRIGRVLECQSPLLVKVFFSKQEILPEVRVLSINGLQKSPNPEDLVLVFCPQGDPRLAIILAVIDTQALANKNETVLTQNDQNKLVLGEKSLKLQSKDSLGEILSQLLEMIQAISSPGYFLSGAPGTAVTHPLDTLELKNREDLKTSIQRFK